MQLEGVRNLSTELIKAAVFGMRARVLKSQRDNGVLSKKVSPIKDPTLLVNLAYGRN